MLERRTAGNGVVYYASTLLEALHVPHGFSTRLAGTSPAPFDSLNLGNPNGCDIQDNYARIWENYRLLQDAIGCPEAEMCRVHQVHGAAVVRASAGETFDVAQKADAIVASNDPTHVLSARVADCVPILLASDDGRTVAAIHAGWRGVVAGIAIKTLREVTRDGRSADRVIVAIGPAISGEAFEVGPEVVAEFERLFGPKAPMKLRQDGKGSVDLRQAIRLQLLAAGVQPDRIDISDRCTFRDKDEFFSHRRDNGITGRMAALIQSAEC